MTNTQSEPQRTPDTPAYYDLMEIYADATAAARARKYGVPEAEVVYLGIIEARLLRRGTRS